jgi:hypothetical protein
MGNSRVADGVGIAVGLFLSGLIIYLLVMFVLHLISGAPQPTKDDAAYKKLVDDLKQFRDDIHAIKLPQVVIHLPDLDALKLGPIIDKLGIPDLGTLENALRHLPNCPMDCDAFCVATNAYCDFCRLKCKWLPKGSAARKNCYRYSGCDLICSAGHAGCDAIETTCHPFDH